MGNIFNDFTKARQFHFVFLGSGILGAIVYLMAYHAFPVFAPSVESANVIGSSAAVMGIVVATATLVPDFSIRMLFLGDVKLKYPAVGNWYSLHKRGRKYCTYRRSLIRVPVY
jgi:membrane associated rhomboid family serine protease